MNTLFLDTSALFKRYIPEKGSLALDKVFRNAESRFITNLTITEIVSNLRRLVDVEKLIDGKKYQAAKAELMGDIADGTLKVSEVTTADILSSVDLISKRYISPIDAIQLAVSLRLASREEEFVFICADKKLCRIAEKEGLSVLNPSIEA
ncbi:MAG: type II toxin-antitoxin system VapC family toxin [Firmicutes bacterium]|nr:type II toxin-antitoxin system VapC family toxin [Bacillota bacterium]